MPIDTKSRHIELVRPYDPEVYKKYDDYDAIETKIKTSPNAKKGIVVIPKDYDGYMGVTLNFLNRYDPDQFKIISLVRPRFQGKAMYQRILIKRRL